MRLGFTNRWLVVAGSTVGMTFSVAPLLFQSFGVFLKPIASEFGAQRASVAAALMVGNFALIIGTLVAGRLVDRWGARSVIAISITLLSLAAASMWLAHSLPAFIVLFGIAAFCGSGQTAVPYADILSSWFDARRGIVLGIAMAGIGLGVALLPQIAQPVIALMGWRAAYVTLALVSFLAAQSALVLFIRPPPVAEPPGPRTLSNRLPPGISAAEALRSRTFWLLAIPIFLVVMVTVGTSVHLVALLTDQGISAAQATTVLSVVGASQLLGRICGGYAVDRFHAPKVAAVFFAAPILGLALLAVYPAGGASPYIAAALTGLSLGAEMDLMAFMVSRYFGLKAFGETFGYLFAIFNLGASVGPIAMAVSFDRTGSYRPAVIVFALALAVASFLIARVGAYKYPARDSVLGATITEAPARS